MYIYERKEGPHFTWDLTAINDLLVEINFQQKKLLSEMKSIGFQLKEEIIIQILTENVLKTSEIEGEKLDAAHVKHFIAKKLGLDIPRNIKINHDVKGVVSMTMDACENFDKSLTKNRLLKWHTALFSDRENGYRNIMVGRWHTKESGVLQVVSGGLGREKIHFEAPGYDQLQIEMTRFLKWYNSPSDVDLLLKAAIAHFWFVTIHPFDDGNGRISRAIADMILAKSEGNPQRFYSMSAQIEKDKNQYYAILESCQKGSLDITVWLVWFLNCLKKAILIGVAK